MFLVQFFVNNAKMTLEHFLNVPNQTNFENRENTEIAGNSVKTGRFLSSKPQNWAIFSIYLLEIFYSYTPDRVLSQVFRLFENSENFPDVFENNIFC